MVLLSLHRYGLARSILDRDQNMLLPWIPQVEQYPNGFDLYRDAAPLYLALPQGRAAGISLIVRYGLFVCSRASFIEFHFLLAALAHRLSNK